jgi:hypothetical protein
MLPFSAEPFVLSPAVKNVMVRIYKTINLSVVLCGCGTWSLTVREEHKLRVFENRVMRIFGPKKDEWTGGWIKLCNEELHDLYSLRSIIRNYQVKEDEVGGACCMNRGQEDCVQVIVRKARGKETTRKIKT